MHNTNSSRTAHSPTLPCFVSRAAYGGKGIEHSSDTGDEDRLGGWSKWHCRMEDHHGVGTLPCNILPGLLLQVPKQLSPSVLGGELSPVLHENLCVDRPLSRLRLSSRRHGHRLCTLGRRSMMQLFWREHSRYFSCQGPILMLDPINECTHPPTALVGPRPCWRCLRFWPWRALFARPLPQQGGGIPARAVRVGACGGLSRIKPVYYRRGSLGLRA